MNIAIWIFAIVVAAVVLIVGLALIAPLFVPSLLNNPNHPHKPHFFTQVDKYSAKLIRRGGTAFRYLLYYPEHTFRGGEYHGDKIDKYDIVREDGRTEAEFENHVETIIDGAEKEKRSVDEKRKKHDPFSESSFPPYRWWKSYILEKTGAYFTGIWPFQKVYSYPLDRVELIFEDDGSHSYEKKTGDRSDFVNLRLFTWFFVIKNIEIGGKIPMTFKGSVLLRCVNPDFAMQGSGGNAEWHKIVEQSLYSELRIIARKFSVDQVLGSVDDDGNVNLSAADAYMLEADLMKINDAMQGTDRGLRALCGMEMRKMQITDVEPELEKEEMLALRAPFIEQQNAKGRKSQGIGEANFLREIAKVLEEGGDKAIIVQKLQAQIQTAEAGNSTILFGTNEAQGNSGLEVLILDQLKKLGIKPEDLNSNDG